LAAAAGCPGAAAAAQKPRKTAAGAVDVSRETIISGEKWTICRGVVDHL
jgi:DNA-binding XRE family transcriptional regulator